MPIEKILKRNGSVAEFDRTRIEAAIQKACQATHTQVGADFLGSITDGVIADLEQRFPNRTPGVEEIQDIVEHRLAARGMFTVSKAYILYRREREDARRAKLREVLVRVERSDLTVAKRDGRPAGLDVGQIEEAVGKCCRDLGNAVDVPGVLNDCKASLYDGISTREINQAVVLALRARIERDPVYSGVTARFLFNDLYKDVLGIDEWDPGFVRAHEAGFANALHAGVEAGRLDPRMLEFDLPRLAARLDPQRDHLYGYLGAQVLYDRYFLRDMAQRIFEVPQYFWMRVAMGLSLLETKKEDRALEFYDVISSLRYVPSTPTLFHSGTRHSQMSSCYLTTVNDDLDHIFKCVGDNAQLSKWSGGLGNDWTSIRATGAQIKSTNVKSQGVIPFLKIVDSATASINRSGKRRGATCVYLETWHYDIEEFLELRRNTGDDRRRTHDLNTANWIPDLFMKRVMNDGPWTLLSPDEAPDLHHLFGRRFEERYESYEALAQQGKIRLFKVVRAVDLWRKMITMLFETGHPWMTFKDPCNIRSPQDHAGVVHSSNLCTEITLNTSAEETAVCNLGSINLARHVVEDRLDPELLTATARTAMRMLDNVIDLNFYPTPESRTANLRHRPVGLGVMGYQDALYQLGIAFDSREAVRLSDHTMELISYHAILGSSQLAREKGSYGSFRGSKWDRGMFPLDTVKLLEQERGLPTGMELEERLDWTPVREHVRLHGMRNSNCLAIAPTATIANIAGCFPSIEPVYGHLYVKSNFSGEFTIVNDYLVEDLRRLGLWDDAQLERLKRSDGVVDGMAGIPREVRDKYKGAFEIDPYWVIEHAAARGKWIDQSQSLNFFSATTSGRKISDIYLAAWRKGLKTTYYLRTRAASAVEKSTLNLEQRREAPPTPREEGTPVPATAVTPGAACNLGEACESCQ